VNLTIVDNREHNTVILTKLKELGIDYEIKKLPVGDFTWNGIIVERKSINDFLYSTESCRIYTQLENMIYNLSCGAERAILIIHGMTREINRRYFSDFDFYGMLGQILIDFPKVNVIFLPTDVAVANVLASMYFKTYQPLQVQTWIRKTKNPAVDVLRLSGFSLKQSKEILKHYSLQQVFNLSDKELKEIKYIGAATARKFIALRKKRVNN
jgi:ERCC4-type nuclease